MYSSRTIFKLIIASLYLVTITKFSSARRNKYPISFGNLATCKEFDIESESCGDFFPIENIKNYESSDYKLYLKFYVMTTNDANIVLSNNSSDTNSVKYTIVIGGHSNTYSWIRNIQEKTVGLDSHLTDILSPLWATPLVVRQRHSGELEVAIPHVVDPLLKTNATDLDVHSVCLYAWKTESRWFYNCAEQIDIRNDQLSTLGLEIQNDSSV